MMWVFLYPQESEGRTWIKVYRDILVKFHLGNTAAQNHPGKVSLATTAALTSEKKLKYFLPMCCDLVKMYYLCTSNKSNNLNF